MNELSVKLKDRLSKAFSAGQKVKPQENGGWKVFWGEFSGVPIYIVDGAYVRNHFSVGFVTGANSWARRWMPQRPKQIWVEMLASRHDMSMNLNHELTESMQMRSHKMSYDPAHDNSEEIEGLTRNMAAGIKPNPTREDQTGN